MGGIGGWGIKIDFEREKVFVVPKI